MPNLEIITIGTELLLGEITNTNSTYIARTLRDHGIDIYRITTIGDNPARISSAIQEALSRADIVITTGGLGPTVDDPTRQAVAMATDRKLIYHPELWQQIEQRFRIYGRNPTENNRRQAYIPEGAIPIDNPIGTAPCYILEIKDSFVISLPGVPNEMKFILSESIIPFLSIHFSLKSQIIKATVLHAASIGESVIDELIEDLEYHTNPTVGLLAHPGQVDIRVTAKASSELEARTLITPVVNDLKARLGENIYGQDDETLENIISQLLNQYNLKLLLTEYGLDGQLTTRLMQSQPEQIQTKVLDKKPQDIKTFKSKINSMRLKGPSDICFGIALVLNDRAIAYIVYSDSKNTTAKTQNYGGPHDNAQLWAQNIGLDFLRRQLMNTFGNQETGES